MTDTFHELMSREERLLPDLKPHLREGPIGLMLHHPLMIEIVVDPMRAAMVNQRFVVKTQIVAKALAEHNWTQYLMIHERPYRLDALMTCRRSGCTGQEFWDAFRYVWIDTENVHEFVATWRSLWRNAGRDRVMSDKERTKLAAMPDALTVWRGAHPMARNGLSWSLDRDKALWFARRLARKDDTRYLIEGRVAKSDVLALFVDRAESEIVSDRVEVVKTEEV